MNLPLRIVPPVDSDASPPSGMEQLAHRLVANALAHHAGRGADPARIADAIVSMWQMVDAALSPIIGKRGVAALHARSVQLVVPVYPWLAGTHDASRPVIDGALLKTALVAQGSADVVAASDALLRTFCKLLAGLIGPSLTAQLLDPLMTDPPGTGDER